MLDRDEFERWRAEAESARRGARLQTDAGLHNWACFLAEQAAQLAVKGLLRGIGERGWGHDLVELGEKLEQGIDERIPDHLVEALQRLSRHYIPSRYVDAHPAGPPGKHYSAADAEQALEDASRVLSFTDSTWRELLGAAGGEE